LPTPNTQEPTPVVTRLAEGAPDMAPAPPIAPTAPDPFVPVVLTPEKLITVIEAATDCESVAVTVAPVSGAVAKARQISAVPLCALVRRTSVQVRLPPAMLFTVVFVPLL
jgi:hypothetical protein